MAFRAPTVNRELARAAVCRRAFPAKAAPFPRSDFAINSQLFGGWERRFTTFGGGDSQFGPLDSQLDSQLFGRPTAKRERKWRSGSRDRHSHGCGCSQVRLPLTTAYYYYLSLTTIHHTVPRYTQTSGHSPTSSALLTCHEPKIVQSPNSG